MRMFLFCVGLFLLLATSSHAETFDEWKERKLGEVGAIWRSDHYDVYVPFYAWHNRLAYDDEHISRYNEKAFGFGIGKSLHDEKGDWYGLYAFGFKDSNSKFETVAGYAYQKNWKLMCNNDFRIGIGYTLGMTQRHEYAYIPIPMPLPIAGIEYGDWAFQVAYVPGLHNFGNVALFWMRYQFY